MKAKATKIFCPRCGNVTEASLDGAISRHDSGNNACKLTAVASEVLAFLAEQFERAESENRVEARQPKPTASKQKRTNLYAFQSKTPKAHRGRKRREVVLYSDLQGKGFNEISGGAPGLGKRK